MYVLGIYAGGVLNMSIPTNFRSVIVKKKKNLKIG
jgi:hypothetical protein